MAGIFSFTCSSCGELHEGSPSFGFLKPDLWLEQPEEIKETGAINDDLCYYEDEDGMHCFVRVVLDIPIKGIDEPFTWGAWVSVSEESYNHYVETWKEPDIQKEYFGWFCSRLPYYEDTYALATDVHQQACGQRPSLVLHECEHELYQDFINGISIEKAQKVAEKAIHG